MNVRTLNNFQCFLFISLHYFNKFIMNILKQQIKQFSFFKKFKDGKTKGLVDSPHRG